MKKKQFYEPDLFPFSWEIFLTNYYHMENEYNYCLEDLMKTNKELEEAEKANNLAEIQPIEDRRVKLCRIRDRMKTVLACGEQMHSKGLNHELYKIFLKLVLEIYEIEGGIR